MRRREHKTSDTTKKHRRRKALPLPYAAPPAPHPLHVDPNVHTAAELMRSHHTAA